MTRTERFRRFIAYFSKHMPAPATELRHEDPYELLVATILSAQCTDKRVNATTPAFFKKYPTPGKLGGASLKEVFALIKSISYPNNKARHLIGMAKMLTEEFGGRVPQDEVQLQRLPGVGRKTAHVVASCLFGRPVLAVDTHVFRVSARIGLTIGARNPLQAERQIVRHTPTDKIPSMHHWLILHGRYTCTARNPKCGSCPVTDICQYYSSQNR